MKTNNTIEILRKIKNIYLEQTPFYVSENMIEKATEVQIQTLEALIGEELPIDYKNFLLENDLAFNFEGNFKVMSISNLTYTWRRFAELLEKGVFGERVMQHEKKGFKNWEGDHIQKVWWSKKWLPFAEDSCGNVRCIDFAPAYNGTKYQIIAMEIQDQQGPYFMNESEDFKNYLHKHLEYLLNKDYNLVEYRNGEMSIEIEKH